MFSSSPRLIAAYYVLHRRPSPRHPLFALNILTARYKNHRSIIKHASIYTQHNYVIVKDRCKHSFASLQSYGGERVRTADLLLARQALSQAELHPRFRKQTLPDAEHPASQFETVWWA